MLEREIARPHGLDSDRGYYYVLLAAVAAAVLLVTTVERARLGRLLRALADSPLALATHGTSVNVTRVIVFCVSAFLAAVSGGLLAAQTGVVNADSFAPFQSLTLVAVLVIAGRRPVSSAFVAAASLVIVPVYVDSPDITSELTLLFGLAALAVGVVAGGTTSASRGTTADPSSRSQRRLAPGGAARLLRPVASA